MRTESRAYLTTASYLLASALGVLLETAPCLVLTLINCFKIKNRGQTYSGCNASHSDHRTSSTYIQLPGLQLSDRNFNTASALRRQAWKNMQAHADFLATSFIGLIFHYLSLMHCEDSAVASNLNFATLYHSTCREISGLVIHSGRDLAVFVQCRSSVKRYLVLLYLLIISGGSS